MCVAIKRVFVHESRYEEMVDAMKTEAAKAKDATGDGLDEETKFGPINNRMQLARVRETPIRPRRSCVPHTCHLRHGISARSFHPTCALSRR